MKKSLHDVRPFQLPSMPTRATTEYRARGMSGLAMLRIALREWVIWADVARVREPEPVMDDPQRVAVYVDACRDAGIMRALHLFHAAHACDVIAPGDTVLDLGCGPGLQLALLARLNPQARFVGVDCSLEMLDRARETIAAWHLDNVELLQSDITRLPAIASASIDAIVSTMTLHHLPDAVALGVAFSEAARVLRSGGGVYLADVGHLRSERSMRAFAYQYADSQPSLFTTDYMDSLRAAFSYADFRRAARALTGAAEVYRTCFVPFMLAVKSRARRAPDAQAGAELRAEIGALPVHHRGDIQGIDSAFRVCGLSSLHLPR